MTEENILLEQTAIDYDMPLWLVEKVYKDDRTNFYTKLEELLAERRKEQFLFSLINHKPKLKHNKPSNVFYTLFLTVKIMNPIAKEYLNRSLFYKSLYKKCSWWQFKKKAEMKRRWYEARDKMCTYDW